VLRPGPAKVEVHLSRGILMEFIARDEGRFKIITLTGKIGWEDARDLDEQVSRFIDVDRFIHVVFDLDNVTFISSGGIGTLIYNLNKVRRENGQVYLVAANKYMNYMFEILKFDIVFDGFLFKTYDDFHKKIIGTVG
jgi:anti-anti-sigma factor